MRRVIAAVLLAFVTSLSCAHAGTSGVLDGYIRSTQGVPLSGAYIKAVSASGIFSITSDTRGFFIFLDLPPDIYTIEVEKLGHTPVAWAGVRVSSDQTIFMTIPLSRYCGDRLADTALNRATADDVYSVELGTLFTAPENHVNHQRGVYCL